MDDPRIPPGIDISQVSAARAYDYMLGGKDNYPVDREAVEAVVAIFPGMRDMGRAVRAFEIRAVRYLAADAGIDQFIDIGSGLPTVENVHQVAQHINPAARVMYVDNDPIVLAHGRALLAENKRTDYAEADARDPEVVLAAAGQLLDLSRPTAVIASAILHFIPEDPTEYLGTYVRALAPGSYLALSHNTADGAPPDLVELITEAYSGHWYPRSPDHIARMFQGWPMVEPGLVRVDRWRPAGVPIPLEMPLLGGIARIG